MAITFKLKNVRSAFNEYFTPKGFQDNAKLEYSGAFLFAPNHPQVGELYATMQKVAQEKWGADAPKVYNLMRQKDHLAVHDGSLKPDLDGYAGMLYINARNKARPLVVDIDGRTPLAASDGRPYSGCYVNVVIEFWAQDNSFGKKINASLKGVQFLRDGDAFSGGGVASVNDFEDMSASDDIPFDASDFT